MILIIGFAINNKKTKALARNTYLNVFFIFTPFYLLDLPGNHVKSKFAGTETPLAVEQFFNAHGLTTDAGKGAVNKFGGIPN